MTLTNERCYEIWAPDGSSWSAWAKPVLFSQMSQQALKPSLTGLRDDVSAHLPAFARSTALVVDLNGHDSVRVGLELARRGWRPVPLFNATTAPKALVDVVPIMEMLMSGGEVLEAMVIRSDAPPAFLLDAQRMIGKPTPGDYDNRSIVMPQDCPSATLLRSRGIDEVVLIEESAAGPREDLRHVLLRWQQGGVRLRWHNLNGSNGDLAVTPPSLFRKAWYRMIVLFGFRRRNTGGFGAVVPEESSGGYG